MTSFTEVAPHGQQIASEDRRSSDRLERMQRQRRILGEAISQSMAQSTSSPSLLNARSEETAAFFVRAAATKTILRHSSSEGGAVLDTDSAKQPKTDSAKLPVLDTDSAKLPKLVSFFPMVQVYSEIPRRKGKHEILTDRDNEEGGSSPR